MDRAGKRTEYEHDAVGRVLLERRSGLEHELEYDPSGNRIAYVNPKGARMGFGYDLMNRVVAETNAIGYVTRYVYDSVGNLREKINANGQTNLYSYNALNHLISRQSALENVSFGYDPNGNLTNMVDGLGTTRQTFDSMNRLTHVIEPFGQVVVYQYNLAGARTQITYPDGKTQTFAYDGIYRMTNSGASSFGLSAASYAYDSRNNLIGASLPGGLSRSNTYDSANRLTAWSAKKAGSNLLARTITRNALGFRTNETIAAGLEALDAPVSQTHQHDAADRITGITQIAPPATNLPSSDAAGNLTQLVLTVKGQTFTTRYGYDINNRLTAVTRTRNAPDGSTVTTAVTHLEYDGQGLLLQLTENGNVRRLIRDRVDSLARPLVEMGATTNAARWFVWSNGRLLAQVHSNGTIRIAHGDELGRSLALTDENGGLTDEFAYGPYGRLIAHDGTTDLNFLFMGDYGVLSAGHGLHLTRHRAYDSNLARFLQADPIGLDGGWNLYVYAMANPLTFLDFLGLEAIRPAFVAPRRPLFPVESPRQGPDLRAGGVGDYTSPNPAADQFLSALGAPAFTGRDSSRRAQIAAAPIAAAGSGVLIIAAPALANASATPLSLEIAAQLSASGVSIPTAIEFTEGFLGPQGPSDHPAQFLGGQTRLLIDRVRRQ